MAAQHGPHNIIVIDNIKRQIYYRCCFDMLQVNVKEGIEIV